MNIEEVNMRISILQDAYQRKMVDRSVYRIKMDDLITQRKALTQKKLDRDQRMEQSIRWMSQMLTNKSQEHV
ncbi:hypothetical protein [Natribacillus halophilus]|uniref:Uncharacterized protein n=1 Tax=Natribacillus halophilus TaxID=549003 RepID=A0A1G8P2H1_9BACI|nr:hypothetical protein [Natribacillus halophilus]SDI86632.1 hypothetical protein SAMN04488123_107158 [Natribacillus halophilus]